MSRRWIRVVRAVMRKLSFPGGVAAAVVTTAALATPNHELPPPLDPPAAHADIVTRIAAVRAALEVQQDLSTSSADDPPARALQWYNWPNWNNWRNWNNWNNWGNWINY